MTTLNTIIEEEVKAVDELHCVTVRKIFYDDDGGSKAEIVNHLTSAMQRAYEAGEREENKRVSDILKRAGFRVKTLLK